MKRTRVLHVITRLEQGGAPLALIDLLRRLDACAFDISLAVGEAEDPSRAYPVEDLDLDIPVYSVPSLMRSVHPVRDALAFLRLIGIIRRGDYQIVHTHTSKAGILGRFAAAICRVPIVIHSSHGNILEGYFSSFVAKCFSLAEQLAALVSTRIVCLTSREIEQYIEAGIGRREQYCYIYNGIDTQSFIGRVGDRDAIRRSLGLSDDHVVCLTTGRLVPIKGHSDLLEGFALASKEDPRLRLLVVGDGELREDLENQSRALDIQDTCSFLGWRDDVPELLDACDIFVLTSLNEGLGLALVEAMSKRLPVIATRVGGVAEVLDHGKAGILIPPHDPSTVASQIARLARDPGERNLLGKVGYVRATEVFSAAKTASDTEDLYRQITGTVDG